MGINYRQIVIFGVKFDPLVRTIPAVYKTEQRYDTKTGEPSHTERVLVKQQRNEYELFGVESDRSLFELEDGLVEELAEYRIGNDKQPVDIHFNYEDGNIYIGKLFAVTDYGRVDLVEGSVSFDELKQYQNDISKVLETPKKLVKLYFLSRID